MSDFDKKLENYVTDLNNFIKSTGEGYSNSAQIYFYKNLLETNKNIKRIIEIGFNVGLSSFAFLNSREDVKVLSIDLGEYNYILGCKKLIDGYFPERHLLLIGDSTSCLPGIKDFLGGEPVDLFFIDGNHIDPYPQIDLNNAINCYCDKDTIIMIDDWCETYGKNGVIQTIENSIKSDKIELIEKFEFEDRGWGLFRKK